MQKSNLKVVCIKNQFISKWENGTKHFFKQVVGMNISYITTHTTMGANESFARM